MIDEGGSAGVFGKLNGSKPNALICNNPVSVNQFGQSPEESKITVLSNGTSNIQLP